MLKERASTRGIDEKEFTEILTNFRNISVEKQTFALAFINGMKFQKQLDSKEPAQDMERERVF